MNSDRVVIRRALIGVADKAGVADFARALERHGVEIVSTGGTMAALQAAGVKARSVESFTGSPEMLDGRVKTLHPKIHGAILARRGDAEPSAPDAAASDRADRPGGRKFLSLRKNGRQIRRES